jgi:hypothetical protein
MKGVWKVRPADLRRIAAQTREPERERKMLALAEELEEQERTASHAPRAPDQQE